jgi:hypothetical protein
MHASIETTVVLRKGWVGCHGTEREIFIDNLLFRVHSMIKMILVDRPCATGVGIPFSGSLISTFLGHGTGMVRLRWHIALVPNEDVSWA